MAEIKHGKQAMAAVEALTGSTYPDAQYDRHGVSRDVPAAEWSTRRLGSYSRLARGLAASLVPYVSEDDVELTREQFLRTVVDRIEMDLRDKTT